MTTAASRRPFPTPAEVDAATPDGRDRAIHVIRIAALTGVVVGHTRPRAPYLDWWPADPPASGNSPRSGA